MSVDPVTYAHNLALVNARNTQLEEKINQLLFRINALERGLTIFNPSRGTALATSHGHPFSPTSHEHDYIEDDAYGAGWNDDTTHAPTQNAVYDKINALSFGDVDSGTDFNSHSEQIKAGFTISGGGTITVNGAYRVGWTLNFMVINNGNGAHFSTSGYFYIAQPTSGTITAVGGGSANTWTAAGIYIPSWQSLYYILPIGSNFNSIAANFRMVGYTSALEVPDDWIFIAGHNGDSNIIKFGVGITLNDSETWITGTSSMINTNAVAGDLNHNDLANLNAGTVYEHISAAQVSALHAAITTLTHTSLTGKNDETNVKHLTDAQITALHAVYTDAQVDAIVLTHKNIAGAHHTKYSDADAVTAMGAKADGNPLNHDKADYDAALMIGETNAEWVKLGWGHALAGSVRGTGFGAANATTTNGFWFTFRLLEPFNKGGLSLRVKEMRITVGDADGSNYIDRTLLRTVQISSGSAGLTVKDDDGSNRTTEGVYTYAFTTFDLASDQSCHVTIAIIVGTIDALEITEVEFLVYYV